MSLDQGLINHVGLVIDRSGSMHGLTQEVVKVADGLTQHLAQKSQELDQETRISLYVFDNTTDCINYDKDVLRLPSLRGRNTARGGTALIDATMQAITDLEKTATLYGDHAFIVYVLTDGEENQSHKFNSRELREKIGKLPDNWTIAALVPGLSGEREAETHGFLKGNIAQWNTNVEGVREVGRVVQQATDNFMRGRALGIRGSNNIFQVDVSQVNTKALVKVPEDRYTVFPVMKKDRIDEFAERNVKRSYQRGKWYYQLSKPEDVQPQKIIVIMDNASKEVYTGTHARDMLGLPKNYTIRVRPDDHPRFTIFVQSTSLNRNLVPGTIVLYMP